MTTHHKVSQYFTALYLNRLPVYKDSLKLICIYHSGPERAQNIVQINFQFTLDEENTF